MPSAEEDYIERARDLWLEYQFYIYTGLAMIVAAIVGFTLTHNAYETDRAAANAHLYEVIARADEGELAGAEEAFAQLQTASGDFQELAYLAAFVLSSLHFDAGDYPQAAAILQPALDGSGDEGMRQLAALRMAEAMIAAADYSQAVELLRANEPAGGRLRIMFEERIGDAEFTAGNRVAAREAYERAAALAAESASFYQPLLNIKLGALLSTPEAAAQAYADEEENAPSETAADDETESETDAAAAEDAAEEAPAAADAEAETNDEQSPEN